MGLLLLRAPPCKARFTVVDADRKLLRDVPRDPLRARIEMCLLLVVVYEKMRATHVRVCSGAWLHAVIVPRETLYFDGLSTVQ